MDGPATLPALLIANSYPLIALPTVETTILRSNTTPKFAFPRRQGHNQDSLMPLSSLSERFTREPANRGFDATRENELRPMDGVIGGPAGVDV